MKKILCIINIISLFFVCFWSGVLVWWKKGQGHPSFAENLSGWPFVIYLSIAVLVFVVITIILVYKFGKK